jgi:predicted aldo/keto reductase-like oxidoreductase
MKLTVGTAQFGMHYNINNKIGIITQSEIVNILTYAKENQIDILDTTYNYGNGEEKIIVPTNSPKVKVS